MKNSHKRITLRDVAEMAKVSMMTVSRVCNDASYIDENTRKRVLDAIRTLNYQPNLAARHLSRSRGKNYTILNSGNTRSVALNLPHKPAGKMMRVIGVLIPYPNSFVSDYFLRILNGIQDAAQKNEYDLIIYNCPGKERRREIDYLHLYDSGLVDGLMIIAPHDEDLPVIDPIGAHGVPFVLLSARRKNISYVDGDNVNGAYTMVKHLIEAGHHRIATIAGDLRTTNGQDRLAGFEKALREHRLEYDRHSSVIEGGFSAETAYQKIGQLFALKHRPTAIFCANDYMAAMSIHACNEKGIKVPENMSIVGYDDCDFSNGFRPPISSVRQPCYEIGSQAFLALLQIIEKKTDRVQIVLSNDFFFRESCCKKHVLKNDKNDHNHIHAPIRNGH